MRHANTIHEQADQHSCALPGTDVLCKICCNMQAIYYVVSIIGDGEWSVGSTITLETTLTDNKVNSGVNQVKYSHWLAKGGSGSPQKHHGLVDQGKGNLASDFQLSHYKRLSVSLRSELLASLYMNKQACTESTYRNHTCVDVI